MSPSKRPPKPLHYEPVADKDVPVFAAPLTIGLISDTHINAGSDRSIPLAVLDLFLRFQVGLILHAGDVNVQPVLDRLAEIAPVLAVPGNNDELLLLERLPHWQPVQVGSTRIALLHGDGGKSAKTVATTVFDQPADVVVFGHSHKPEIDAIAGVIYINPGSPTDRRYGPHFGIGLLTVTAERVFPELILFRQPEELRSIQPSQN